MDYAAFLEEQLPIVDRVVRGIARSSHLSAADADDFRSEAMLHLIADDYRVLRAFEGRSSLSTYLNVVLRRLWQDRCARRWGRWRPSAEARRLGRAAVQLERLTQRDGLTLGQAIATIQSGTAVEAEALRAMWQRLPLRVPRRRVDDDALAHVADPRLDVATSREHQETARDVARVLRAALSRLPQSERDLLHLRFVTGATMADTARRRGIRQMAVYPRFERILRDLRRHLRSHDIHGPDLAHVGVAGRL